MRRTTRRFLAAAVALPLLAGCDLLPASGASGADAAPGMLRIGGTAPGGLLPAEAPSAGIVRMLYTGLVDYNPGDGAVVNALAASVQSPDRRVWTIKIRPGYRFHNGEPVDAEAFVRAWNFAAYGPNRQRAGYLFERIDGYPALQPADPDGTGPKGAGAPASTRLAGLAKLDAMTLRVTLSEPFVGFPVLLGHPAYAPLASACLRDVKACRQRPIGNGPFRLERPGTDRKISLVRDDRYAGAKPAIERLVFQVYGDPAAAYADFVDGRLDLIDVVPPGRLTEARGAYGDRLVRRPAATLTYLALPLNQPRYADRQMRQAVSMAIDRQAIVDSAFKGARVPAGRLAPEGVVGARPKAYPTCVFSPSAARAALAAAGGWPGGKIELWFNGDGGHEGWMRDIGEQLKANLGIDYELRGELSIDDYLDTAAARRFTGPFRLTRGADYPLLEDHLTPLFTKDGPVNHSGYVNPELDELVALGSAADALGHGVALYQRAEDMVLDDLPVIPLWFGRTSFVTGERVKEITYNPATGVPDYRTAVLR